MRPDAHWIARRLATAGGKTYKKCGPSAQSTRILGFDEQMIERSLIIDCRLIRHDGQMIDSVSLLIALITDEKFGLEVRVLLQK
jgi:hypothetical protein